jgi:hypothetical protein
MATSLDLPTLRSVMRNVCGIGFFPADVSPTDLVGRFKPGDALPLTIVGTGFLIRPQMLLTARHVVDSLTEPVYGLGSRAIPRERIVFVFIDYLESGKEISITFARRADTFMILTEEPDTASRSKRLDLTWTPLLEPIGGPGAANPPRGLPVLNTGLVHVGQSIVVPSYYATEALLNHWTLARPRYGPTLLHGHVAAISPHGLTNDGSATEYLIDITAAGGISGSPVLDVPTGQVLGMVRGQLEMSQPRMPLDVAFALPITPWLLEQVVDQSFVLARWPGVNS